MFEVVLYTAIAVAAAIAALLGYVLVIGTVQINRDRETGWVHLAPYIILLTGALFTLASGRDLTQGTWELLANAGPGRAGWAVWVQRALTLVLLLAVTERIARAVFSRDARLPIPWLMPFFVAYWLCSVASPSFFGRFPVFSYEYLYPLLIGIAVFMLSSQERLDYLTATRNASLVFIASGVVLIPINLGLVLETGYNQGFIPGLPRLAGLSPHALQQGLLVQIALLCLWARPLEYKWLNRSAWAICLFVLLIAQSKTSWISFVLCAAVMVAYRSGGSINRWVFSTTRPFQGVLTIGVVMMCLVTVAYVLAISDLGLKLLNFLDTKEGATLLTLNGRDQIWDLAFTEWTRSPLFGYGPGLLNFEHRASLGMLNATHAHNQFVDDLARAGLVGAVGLVVYAGALFVFALRGAEDSSGLSLALFVLLFIRGISEVPLSMYGYSAEFVGHILLICVVLGVSKSTVKRI